jgi:hypothetical protein
MPTKIELNFDLELEPKDIIKVQRIFTALIKSGGLFGVRSGKTIIHFDQNAEFRKIQFDYYPWIER